MRVGAVEQERDDIERILNNQIYQLKSQIESMTSERDQMSKLIKEGEEARVIFL